MNRGNARPPDQVPYLSRERIGREADLLLAEYSARFSPITRPPVPVDEIIELHLRLRFDLRDLSAFFGHPDVLGALWIPERTVGIDISLDPVLFPSKLGRFRFTLGHEAGHWRLHRELFADDPHRLKLFETASGPTYICRSSDAKKPVERQADYFAARLLMPGAMVKERWKNWRGSSDPVTLGSLFDVYGDLGSAPPQVDRRRADNAMLETFVRPFAAEFAVSAEAMRIRLEELGLLLRGRESAPFVR